MIYTCKGRRVTYSTLAYSDKQLSLYVIVAVIIIIIVARTKLRQSEFGGIYGIE